MISSCSHKFSLSLSCSLPQAVFELLAKSFIKDYKMQGFFFFLTEAQTTVLGGEKTFGAVSFRAFLCAVHGHLSARDQIQLCTEHWDLCTSLLSLGDEFKLVKPYGFVSKSTW